MTNNYFRQADAALLMYDVSEAVTFESLQEWIDMTQKTLDLAAPEQFVWCLVGNQKDRGIKVEKNRVSCRCEYLQTTLNFYTCALTGEGVMETLKAVAETIYSKRTCTRSLNTRGSLKTRGVKLNTHGPLNPCQSC